MNFKERETRFLSEYNEIDSDMERFDYVIDMGIRMETSYIPNEADKIDGCDSGLWLHISHKNGKIQVQTASDAAYVSGIAAIIRALTDELTIHEAAEIETDLPKKMVIGYPMTQNRLLSMEKMLVKIKKYAKNLL